MNQPIITGRKKMICIRIDENLWRQFKAEASRRGKTLEFFMEEILKLVIKSSSTRPHGE